MESPKSVPLQLPLLPIKPETAPQGGDTEAHGASTSEYLSQDSSGLGWASPVALPDW